MDKYEKLIASYYERMKCTLERCAGILETELDEELLRLVYDELVIDALCDLCDANLEILLESNYIYPEIAVKITQLRERVTAAIEEDMNVASIRKAAEWRAITEEAEKVLKKLYI